MTLIAAAEASSVIVISCHACFTGATEMPPNCFLRCGEELNLTGCKDIISSFLFPLGRASLRYLHRHSRAKFTKDNSTASAISTSFGPAGEAYRVKMNPSHQRAHKPRAFKRIVSTLSEVSAEMKRKSIWIKFLD